MILREIILVSRDLNLQLEFYRDTLALPAELKDGALYVTVGRTQLIFSETSADWEGAYHFAFNIPENQFEAGVDWLDERAQLISDEEGIREFDFESWNAHSVYTYDGDGNILELIARHDLANASQAEFSGHSLLNVSEIGIVSRDVMATASDLQARYGLDIFDGEGSETFAALGDNDGLFIVVPADRPWFPDTEIPATPSPLRVSFEVGTELYQADFSSEPS